MQLRDGFVCTKLDNIWYQRYERVWDPEKAEKSGKIDFIHTRIKFNKKEPSYDMFHSRGYRLPGFYEEVSEVNPTDCSDWNKGDKDRFRAAVFEKHENMNDVSNMIGKNINECINYYLVKFKRTKSYKSLKKSMRQKANASEGSAGTLVCSGCGKGGMLIACDTCEAHYHLACASPTLESIPDGTWNCVNCKRETRSMLSSQDEISCSTEHNLIEGYSDVSAERSGDVALKGPMHIPSEGTGNTNKRKLNTAAEPTQKGAISDPIHTNGRSVPKRARTNDAIMATDTTVTAVPL